MKIKHISYPQPPDINSVGIGNEQNMPKKRIIVEMIGPYGKRTGLYAVFTPNNMGSECSFEARTPGTLSGVKKGDMNYAGMLFPFSSGTGLRYIFIKPEQVRYGCSVGSTYSPVKG